MVTNALTIVLSCTLVPTTICCIFFYFILRFCETRGFSEDITYSQELGLRFVEEDNEEVNAPNCGTDTFPGVALNV